METTVEKPVFDRYFAWKNNPARELLYGRRCRIVATGSTMRSCLIEFENGERTVTSVRAIRRMPINTKDVDDQS